MLAEGGNTTPFQAPPMTMKWCCVNKHKNEPFTILFQCAWSERSFSVPTNAEHVVGVKHNVKDELIGEDDGGMLLGSATLQDSVKLFKAREPSLLLMEEYGGLEMHCGTNTVCGSDWETTMLCRLVYHNQAEHLVPRVILDDGRIAVVITLRTKGNPHPLNKKQMSSVVARCLAKGDVYG